MVIASDSGVGLWGSRGGPSRKGAGYERNCTWNTSDVKGALKKTGLGLLLVFLLL